MTNAIAIFDIDGVVRDVSGSYRRALADTVEHFTNGGYRPSQSEIDALKSEGLWNNDWEASQELVYRYYERNPDLRAFLLDSPVAIWHDEFSRGQIGIDYKELVNFFQSRYLGSNPRPSPTEWTGYANPTQWTGYICEEPLLVELDYFQGLTAAGIAWGFFSGASRASASYILERRLKLQVPVLVAMEDAPGKPDPTGLLKTVELLNAPPDSAVIYVGDTVADMVTVQRAKTLQPDRQWIAIGVLPPHVQVTDEQSLRYTETLEKAGAVAVFWNMQELTADRIEKLVSDK
jgi:HAD superfamily phosphatase